MLEGTRSASAVGARTRVKPLRREDAKVKGTIWSDALQKHVALIDDGAMNVKGVACRRVVFEAVNSTVDGYDIDADIHGFGGYAPSTTLRSSRPPDFIGRTTYQYGTDQ